MSAPVALITGASRGIGKRIAIDLAESGYDLVLTARSSKKTPGRLPGTLEDTAKQVENWGRKALVSPLDVRDECAIASLAEQVDEVFGRCDLLVNNAALAPPKPALKDTTKRWRMAIDANINGPFYISYYFVPLLEKNGLGRIVNISSQAATMPDFQRISYTTTKAALNNPLIDEYSLRGAKGLLVNITGGDDLTMFEEDEAVNKIRAEVDPEAELIFGSIEDKNLNGKIRVSIVATSLDGQEPQIKPIVSMIHRLHNRNTGYADNLTNVLSNNQTTLQATEGATALDLNKVAVERPEQTEVKEESSNNETLKNVSMENAAYLQSMEESKDEIETHFKQDSDIPNFEVDSIELATPELFSENEEISLPENHSGNEINSELFDAPSIENSSHDEIKKEDHFEKEKEPKMFEDSESEEDFEIPAFLRRQKN